MRPWGIDLKDPELSANLAEGMDQVEFELKAAVDHVDGYFAGLTSHLLAAGGKRFRPLLTILAGQLGPAVGPPQAEVIKAAVVVELTHLATLYHDDVMDEALLRRGAESANARWGNSLAILTGDLLFARASQLVADLGAEAVRVQASTFELLCSGQIRETVGPRNGEDPVAHYLRVLAEKTGSLIATAGRFGAWFGGCDDATIEVMRRYGEHIGVAFQLADDLIDLSSATDESGKTPGTDLREGVATLPVLLARQSNSPQDAELLHLLAGDLSDDAQLARAVELLRAHPGMERARQHTREWAERAQADLAPLPESAIKETLANLALAVVDRTG